MLVIISQISRISPIGVMGAKGTKIKAQTSVDYSPIEVFALPKQSNKQQETYAGMKTHYIRTRCNMDIIIPIGIYCYFDFDCFV